MLIHFLNLLIVLTTSQNYIFSTAVISINSVSSSVVVDPSTSGDTCGKLIARANQIYHLSTMKMFQSARKWSIDVHTHLQQLNITYFNIVDFDVSTSESKIIFGTSDNILNLHVYHQILSPSYSLSFQNKFTKTLITPTNVFISSGRVWTFAVGINSDVQMFDQITGMPLIMTSFSLDYTKMRVNSAYTIAAIWTGASVVMFMNMTDLTILATKPPPSFPTYPVTQTITFSQDSLLAIVETDHFNPIYIYNLTNFQIIHNISINQKINQVHFLDASNEILLVFCSNQLILVDLVTGNQYSLPSILATSITTDWDSNIFTCANDFIDQLRITYTRDTQFYYPLMLEDDVDKTFKVLNDTLYIVSNATTWIYTATSSLPFSIYFLSMLNYFTMCSIYVLLNFPMPEQIYKILAFVYNQLNEDLLAMFGVNIELEEMSQEKMSRKKGLFFGVSTDYVPSNLVAFIFMIGNILFILALQFLSTCLRKSNYLRKLLKQEKPELINGQIINVMTPLVLPWSFMMLEMGVRNFKTKICAVCHIFSFFMGLVFPIYYLFELLSKREKQLIIERNEKIKLIKERIQLSKRAKFINNQKKLNKGNVTETNKEVAMYEKLKEQCEKTKVKYDTLRTIGKMFDSTNDSKKQKKKLKKKQEEEYPRFKVQIIFPEDDEKQRKVLQESLQKVERKLQLKDLISVQILEQWYLCQLNFILPCLVFLSNPTSFFVVILTYSLLGVILAFKKKQKRINSFILSLYPLVFHVCFMIFFWCQSAKVVIFTELVCLIVYLLGSIHHSITFAYEIIIFLFQLVKKLCKGRNQIDPNIPKTKKTEEKQSKKNGKQNKMSDGKKKQKNIEKKGKVKIKKQKSIKKNKNLNIDLCDQ